MIWAAIALQVVTAPAGQADTSALEARVQAAQDTATTVASTATAAQAAATTACQPDASVPPMETVGGSAGSGAACRLANAVQPRITRTVSGVTLASGQGVVTWTAMPSMPKLTVTPYVTSTDTQVPTCYPVTGTVTTTGATIKCFKTQTLLGLGLVPFVVAPAGVQFDVLAIPAS